jgi:hypothetical protein
MEHTRLKSQGVARRQLPPMLQVEMACDCHQGFDDGQCDADLDENSVKDCSNSTRIASSWLFI